MTSSDSLGLWGDEGEDIIKDYPIHKACRNGNIVLLRKLLSTFQSFNDILTEDKFYGWAPIHWAGYFGKSGCIDLLLRNGISVNLSTNRFQQTPCHIAAFGGHPQCLKQLINSGANFQAKDYLGETPLHKASRVGNAECIKVLLNTGSKASQCNNNGHTPCDLARIQNFGECVKHLKAAESIEIAEARLNTGDSGQMCNGFMTAQAFANGNGIVNGNCAKNSKRLLVDESIPNFKRVRSAPAFSENFHSDMDCEMDDSSIETESSGSPFSPDIQVNGNGNFINEEFVAKLKSSRASSPGMDMNINVEDDVLWGHENGFGDTAESMPDTYTNETNYKADGLCFRHRQNGSYLEVGYDRNTCDTLRGTQVRGWH